MVLFIGAFSIIPRALGTITSVPPWVQLLTGNYPYKPLEPKKVPRGGAETIGEYSLNMEKEKSPFWGTSFSHVDGAPLGSLAWKCSQEIASEAPSQTLVGCV